MNRRRTTVVAATCLIVSLTASILLLRNADRLRPRDASDDVLYLNSPQLIRRGSLGFDGLMACIYWTRAVQYFGERHFNHNQSYNELAPLLQIATTLDPQLMPAYEFGASFLAPRPPAGAGEPAQAVQLMEYGIAHNPDNWRLYYDLGFVYYTELKDYKKASEAFDRGSGVPNAHPFMKLMAARMAENAGDFTTATMLWTATYQNNKQKEIRENALDHLRSLRVDEDVTNLQAAVTRFGDRTGRLPSSMAELAAAEHLPGIPVDPDGHPYQLDPDGRVLVQRPDKFPFITKGAPPGYKPPTLNKFDPQP
jgi:tetratricopeptide (TPR) repeat protein